jgi:hypothetical protein
LLNFRKKSVNDFKKVFRSFILVQIGAIFFSFAPPQLVNSIPAPPFLSTFSQLRDLGYILKTEPNSLNAGEKFVIEGPSNKTGLSYLNYCIDPVNYMTPANFDYQTANMNSQKVAKIWIGKVFSSDVKLIYEARKCFAQTFLPPPLNFETGVPKGTQWLYWGIESNSLGLVSYKPDGILNNLAESYISILAWGGSWYAWPGLHFMLFCLALCILRFSNNRSVLVNQFILFLLIRYLVFYLIAASMDFRYALFYQLFNLVFYANVIFNLIISTPFKKNLKSFGG